MSTIRPNAGHLHLGWWPKVTPRGKQLSPTQTAIFRFHVGWLGLRESCFRKPSIWSRRHRMRSSSFLLWQGTLASGETTGCMESKGPSRTESIAKQKTQRQSRSSPTLWRFASTFGCFLTWSGGRNFLSGREFFAILYVSIVGVFVCRLLLEVCEKVGPVARTNMCLRKSNPCCVCHIVTGRGTFSWPDGLGTYRWLWSVANWSGLVRPTWGYGHEFLLPKRVQQW